MVRIPLCRCFNHIGSKSNGLWFECKPYVYCYQLKSIICCFYLSWFDTRRQQYMWAFLLHLNVSELHVSICITVHPDWIVVVLSKCIHIGHLLECIWIGLCVFLSQYIRNVCLVVWSQYFRIERLFLYPSVSVFLSQCTEIMRLSVYRSIPDFPVFLYLQCIHIIHADYFLVGL